MSLPIAQFALSKNGRKNFFSIWSGQEAHKVRQLDELDLRYSLRLGLKSYNKSIFALLGDRPKMGRDARSSLAPRKPFATEAMSTALLVLKR